MADVHVPADLAEAVATLDQLGDAVPVAGGTDVLLDRRLGRSDPAAFVDLSGLGELVGVHADGDGVRVGAMTRLETLLADERVRRRLPALAEAAFGVGTPPLRAMATIGGNLCQAAPHGEIAPGLLVHDATMTVAGPAGAREIAADEFLLDTGRTALGHGELLTAVTVPAADGLGAAYLPLDPAGVGVAVGLRLRDGRVHGARVALCWVVPVPRRAPAAEAVLDGVSELGADVVDAVKAAVGEACDPPLDAVQGPVAHRRVVAGVLAARAARIAWQRVTGAWPHGRLSPPGGRLPEVSHQ